MRSLDKYINFIKMYAATNRAGRTDLERCIIQEGDMVSFGVLNYAYSLTVKFEEESISVRRINRYINESYLELLEGGFKFFKIYNMQTWFDIAQDIMLTNEMSNVKDIYHHMLEYKLVNKCSNSGSPTNFKQYASEDEIILYANNIGKYYDKLGQVLFQEIELNLKGNDLAIIHSKERIIQDRVIEIFLTEFDRVSDKKAVLFDLFYLIDYVSAENLKIVASFYLNSSCKYYDITIDRYLDILLKSPNLTTDKRYVLKEAFFEYVPQISLPEIDDTYLPEEINETSDAFDKLEEMKEEIKETSMTSYIKNRLIHKKLIQNINNYENGHISRREMEESSYDFESELETNKEEDKHSAYSWFNTQDLNGKMPKDKEEKELLNRIIKNAFKPKIDLTEEKLSAIEELKKELPNFTEFIDYMIGQVKLNIFHKGKMSFKPVLLLGDPGLGKTYVAQELAKILSTGFEFIDFASTTAAFIIKGSSKQWRDAEEGKILKLMISSPTINPVVLFDEIDKGSNNKNYPPEAVLYQLFEPLNAKNFEDEYMGIKFDASTILNICTANAIETLTSPMLSRMDIFTIEKLNIEQTHYLIHKMYQKTISNYNIFETTLSAEIIKSLENLVPRQIDTAIHKIITKNIEKMSLQDIGKYNGEERLSLKAIGFNPNSKEKKIGF